MEEKTFTVLPMSQDFTLEPGKIYTGSINITNPSDAKENFSYLVTATPYNVSGNEYQVDLTTESDYSQLSKWITIENPEGEVLPNETKEVKFTIMVPDDVPAGGQYASLVVSENPKVQNEENGVQISSLLQIGSVIYANVEGITVKEGEVLENNIPNFTFFTPVVLSASIKNEGNVHTEAVFDLSVTNIFTGELLFPTSDDGSGHFSEIIMPETTKDVSRELENLPAVGIVHISQTIYFNDNVSTNEQDLIICPIWFIVSIIAFIAAVVFFIRLRSHFHKKRGGLVC